MLVFAVSLVEPEGYSPLLSSLDATGLSANLRRFGGLIFGKSHLGIKGGRGLGSALKGKSKTQDARTQMLGLGLRV